MLTAIKSTQKVATVVFVTVETLFSIRTEIYGLLVALIITDLLTCNY